MSGALPVRPDGAHQEMVETPGIESPATSAPSVADRREDNADRATNDDQRRRDVSALASVEGDAVEAALADAVRAATCARRWDVVAQLARELEARRLARAGVTTLDVKRRQRGR